MTSRVEDPRCPPCLSRSPRSSSLAGCGIRRGFDERLRRLDQRRVRSRSATARRTRCRRRPPATLTVGHRQARLPAVLRGQRPDQRQGLRERDRLRDRRQARLRPRPTSSGRSSPFNASYAPGPKDFDFDVNQISITPKRAEQVDFSEPYYEAQQAVVALKDSDLAGATSLADLEDAKIGVQIGTTSLDAVNDVIQPSNEPQVFDNSNDVVSALKNGQVDAVVVDVPTAFYLTAAQVPEATTVGQFTAPGGDKWGALLQKDSPLTDCVSAAIDELQRLRRAAGDREEVDERRHQRPRSLQ